VSSIGYGAFSECFALSSVTIGEGVATICESAFRECESLSTITIPSTVTTIEAKAFAGTALTSVTIPVGVTSIAPSAFLSCNLISLTVAEGNPVYHSVDNCIIETESKTFVIGRAGCVIPDDGSVTSIGAFAFWVCGSSLTSITIPEGVTSIGNTAFSECSYLTFVTLPSTLLSIGEYAFGYCEALATVYYGGTPEQRGSISFADYNDYLTSATWYYYSETHPTEEGNYWHYVDGEIVLWSDVPDAPLLTVADNGVFWAEVLGATHYEFSYDGVIWTETQGRSVAFRSVAGSYELRVRSRNGEIVGDAAFLSYQEKEVALSEPVVNGRTVAWTATGKIQP